jgi:hypothetical protein
MAIKTVNFLPEIFRSDTNKKFLNATLDQLVSQPDLRKINGYIGRKFAPTYKSTDNYQPEPTVERQNYQLESSIVVRDKTKKTQFFSSYIDLLNQIEHNGGNVSDQSRLFSNETYSFDGRFDFDKFINFSQYYWLTDGPDPVDVYGSSIEKEQTFVVTRDPSTGSYHFSSLGSTQNPALHLGYGGTYKFIVDQPGFPFWIQSDPGTLGYKTNQKNISTRDVLGVANNGIDRGTITFSVPQPTQQDRYLQMPMVASADLSTDAHFNDIQHIKLSDLKKSPYFGFDKVTASLAGKTVVFINNDTDDVFWTANDLYDSELYAESMTRQLTSATVATDTTIYVENSNDLTVGMYLSDEQLLHTNIRIKQINGNQLILTNPIGIELSSGTAILFTSYNYSSYPTVLESQRRSLWRINLVGIPGNEIVKLVPDVQVSVNQRVFVRNGSTRSQLIYYLDANSGLLERVPHITAPLPVLYYQDGLKSGFQGEILLSEIFNNSIDISKILNSKTYKSPNGVEFTNGMKVKFGSGVIPASYIDNTYYVEGVGTSIRLINVNYFVSPEGFGKQKDYITINRGSQDLNSWTRSNRWFHIDIIKKTAEYNNTIALIDQTLRANRPIIEFEPDIQLQQYGRKAKEPINILLLTSTFTDAFNGIELKETVTLPHNVKLKDGQRIIFGNDIDYTVRNKIYVVKYSYINEKYLITLQPSTDTEVFAYNNLIASDGVITDSAVITGVEYYFDGTSWLPCQSKTSLNQAPLFDVIDQNGYSLGDTDVYPDSTFVGTNIFSYTTGTGPDDPILGFPLSYRNFNQIGDIQFTNNFDNDTFTYLNTDIDNNVTTNINSVGLLRVNNGLNDYAVRNMWIKEIEPSQQFQIISGVFDGLNRYFIIDILPNETDNTVPHLRVYKNSNLVIPSLYAQIKVGANTYIRIDDTSLVAGDKIDIRIYSDTVSKIGYYEVPKNLDLNTENKNFTTLSLGQMRNHLSRLAENTTRIVGTLPGDSNLRDVPIKRQGGSIVQHASPILYSELFLVDTDANLIKGIDLARHEFQKIKNKYIESVSKLSDSVALTDIPGICDLILKNMNQVKNKSFPWYYSDMIPYGDIKNTITYTVLDAEIRDYEISRIFDDTKLSNNAVLVYINNRQLTKGTDYVFDTTRAGVTINTSYILNVEDTITINEYDNTDGNYIPETPTKLGLYPKFTPMIYLDDTYQDPVYVIQGHDGSITPAFGDMRDDLLLEFEKRIYNNIKINYSKNVFDIFDHIPGKFRSSKYSHTEFTQILTRSFLKWAGANRVDFTTNDYFQVSNPFTWNYRIYNDSIDGERLTGTWRAIFDYFYDTYRPHTNPWEMLGFSEEPDWWQDRYGAPPYTGGNTVMWHDLEKGYIYAGPRAGFDTRFARSGLSKIIPVDDHGELRPPNQFAVAGIDSSNTSASYVVGNQGPVEFAWRRSSDFPYALQQALAVAFPAFYFGTLINVGEYFRNVELDQYTLTSNLQRITPATVTLNGDTTGGSIKRVAGYINWVSDYLRNNGIDPITKINTYLQYVSVQLAYKMAGYTDPTMIEVIAEQSSPTSTNQGVVIPKENYTIELNKSTPINTITYSAVIVERSENGYTVSGYDVDNPYFTIIPSLANNNAYAISVLNDRAVIYKDYQKYKVTIPYGFEFTNKQQLVDFLISYGRYLTGLGIQFVDYDTDLTEQRDFVLSSKEFLNWSQQSWPLGSVLVLSPILNTIKINTTSGVIDNIKNAPGSSRILDTNFTFIKSNQFTVLRDEGNFKLTANFVQTIALAVLDVVEFEHVMVFDNTTVFNDIIYKPELGNRQYRMKLVGSKTGNWTGSLNPGGFIYNSPIVPDWNSGVDYKKGELVSYKSFYYAALYDIVATVEFAPSQWRQIPTNQIKTGLLPNFTFNAGKFNQFFDLDDPSTEGGFDEFSDRVIGFQERQYMTDLGINKSIQAKFYQGFIKEKGTINSVNAFTAAGFNSVSSTVNLYEEWALRIGEYGALNNNKFVEVQLIEGEYTGDPIVLTLLPNNGSSVDQIIGITPDKTYRTGTDYKANIFLNRDAHSIYENDIHTAGYVSMNDINTTIYDIANYSSLSNKVAQMGIGYKIWCAKDFNNDWNVYRLTETEGSIISLSYNIDNISTVTTDRRVSLAYGDLIVIKAFDTRVDGIYQVYSVDSPTKFNIATVAIAPTIKQLQTITGTGSLFKFISSRLKTATDLNSITPLRGWMNGDKLWVDNDINSGKWSVYNKSDPWQGNVSNFNANMKMSANDYVTDGGFGTVTTISQDGKFAAAGMPSADSGRVMAFVSNVVNGSTFTLVANISSSNTGLSNFGASLDSAANVLYVGVPGDGSTQAGNVFVYSFDGNATFTKLQQISSHWTSMLGVSNIGDTFGQSISASTDGRWLFIGAPNKGNVEVFHANTAGVTQYIYANTISNSSAAKFGYTVKTTSDASQTIISAPYETVDGVSSAGAVYVYDRSIETFIANTSASYATQNSFDPYTIRITIDGNLQTITTHYTISGNVITFKNTPIIGSRIDIETSKLQFMERIVSDSQTSGATFGITSHISGNDADIYIASPGYSEIGYYSGIVYRFVNEGAAYGVISSNKFSPAVTVGDSIRLNGQLVTFTQTDVANVAVNINSVGISGVTASVSDIGVLSITSNVLTPYQRLVVSPGPGTALRDLGLNVYQAAQTLKHPANDQVNNFGAHVVSSSDSRKLVIGATGGTTYNSLTLDTNTTTFDQDSTNFLDSIYGSGSVYVYGLVGGDLAGVAQDQYVLVQRLENNSLVNNDLFGSSLAMNDNTLLVGAQNDSGNKIIPDQVSGLLTAVPRTGTYYIYKDISGNVGWDIIRSEMPKVDTRSITSFYIYDKNTDVVLSRLDHIDPAKGRILGVADQDIDYRTPYDPAIYNAAGAADETAMELSVNVNSHWGMNQVGKVWWNLSTMRYLDYEQGSLVYREANWGELFPGSSVEVYEWIMSDVLPNSYTGSGTPKYPNNTAYVVESYVDAVSKTTRSRYYFWVRGKTTIDQDSNKNISVAAIENMIMNPSRQGIPYVQVLRSDTISLHGITNKITANNTILHINYDTLKNTDVIHSEYALIQEGNATSLIPPRFINKLRDSLSGVDSHGQNVPDPTLSPQNKIGIYDRPRQSFFVNRFAALKNWIEYLNDVLINVPVIEEFRIDSLYNGEPLPSDETYDITTDTKIELDYIDLSKISSGYTVLVLSDESQRGIWALYVYSGNINSPWTLSKTQSYNVPFYWTKADWYDSTYDPTVKTDYVVETSNDLLKFSNLPETTTIKVMNNGHGQFEVYRYNASGTRDLVGIQNGTIQFKSSLYDSTVNATTEIRIIFDVILNDIFIKSLQKNLNQMFFFMINYVLTEQKDVDWIFKTSFVSVIQQLRKLEQFPNYIRDNQTYYESYINEVKPYRTSIREYIVDYQGKDDYQADMTDFDLPSIYNQITSNYHSPDGSVSTDAYQLENSKVYSQWRDNHTYSIKEVLVANVGSSIQSPIISLFLSSPVVLEVGNTVTQSSNSASGTVISSSDTGILNLSGVSGTFDTTNYIYDNGANTYATVSSLTTLSDNGYFLEPSVTVKGGGGSGAEIRAVINAGTNTIQKFEVIKPGEGYTSTPQIFINGTGTGAAGYPMLTGQYYLETIPTINLSLERAVTVYTGNLIYQPNTNASGTVYTSSNGNVITLVNVVGAFQSNSYIFSEFANLYVKPAVATQIIWISGNATVYAGNTLTQGTWASATVFSNASGAYEPEVTRWITKVPIWNVRGTFYSNASIAKDNYSLGLYNIRTISTNRTSPMISFNQTVNKSYNKVRTFDTKLKFDRVSYGTQVIDWTPNVTITANTIVSYRGKAYRALTDVYSSAVLKLSGNIYVSGNLPLQAGVAIWQSGQTGNATVLTTVTGGNIVTVANISGTFVKRLGNIKYANNVDSRVRPVRVTNIFDYTKYVLVSADEFDNANDRIWASYQPDNTMLSKDLKKLVYGIEYPGVKVQGIKFDELTSSANTSVVHTGTITNTLNMVVDDLTKLTSDDIAVFNFTEHGYSRGQYLTVINNDVNIVKLSGAVIVKEGDYIKQGTANVKVLTQSSSNVVTVSAPGLTTSGGVITIYNRIPTVGNIRLNSNITTLSGNVLTQLSSGATAIVSADTTDSNVIPVVSITGTFLANSYLYDQAANTGVKVSSLTFSFSALPTSVEPTSIALNTNQVLIEEVTEGNLYITGQLDYIAPSANITLNYYDQNNPLFTDTNIQSDYGHRTVEITLPSNITASYGSIIGQVGGNATAILRSTVVNTNFITLSNVAGIFDTVKNLSLDGNDLAIAPVNISTIIDTQSTLGTRAEDIIVSGGAYYDTFSSHAPEELVPGVTYDTMVMRVYSNIYTNTTTLAHSVVQGMNANVMSSDSKQWPSYYKIDANTFAKTTFLTANLHITDTDIFVADAAVLASPNPSLVSPGTIYLNGEIITYYERDIVQNRLGQIRRSVNGTGAPLVHLAAPYVTHANKLFYSNAAIVQDMTSRPIPGTPHKDTWYTAPATQTLTISVANTVTAGDTITQAITGATGIVAVNSTGTTITLVNSSGVFANCKYPDNDVTKRFYLYKNASNLRVYPTSPINFLAGNGFQGSKSTEVTYLKNNVT